MNHTLAIKTLEFAIYVLDDKTKLNNINIKIFKRLKYHPHLTKHKVNNFVNRMNKENSIYIEKIKILKKSLKILKAIK